MPGLQRTRRCSCRSACAARPARPCAAGRARAASASSEISMPGASAPPRNSPRALTTSKLVEVPKSTTMHGPPYEVVRGQRVADPVGADLLRVVDQHRHPGRTPGSTSTRRARRRSSGAAWSRSSRSTAGTVEQTAMPVDPAASAEPAAPEHQRQLVGGAPGVGLDPPGARRARRRRTAPRTVLVLPMSIGRAACGAHLDPVYGDGPSADVEDRRGVRERADREVVDAGLGDLAAPFQGQPAGGLEPAPAAAASATHLAQRRPGSCCRAGQVGAGLDHLARLLDACRPRPRPAGPG